MADLALRGDSLAELRLEITINAKAIYRKSGAASINPNPLIEILMIALPTTMHQASTQRLPSKQFCAVLHINGSPFIQGPSGPTRFFAYQGLADAVAEATGNRSTDYLLFPSRSTLLPQSGGLCGNLSGRVVNSAASTHSQNPTQNSNVLSQPGGQ